MTPPFRVTYVLKNVAMASKGVLKTDIMHALSHCQVSKVTLAIGIKRPEDDFNLCESQAPRAAAQPKQFSRFAGVYQRRSVRGPTHLSVDI